MPTPFTHLAVTARLLHESSPLPGAVRAALLAERDAFLLGNIAADARISSGLNRENTHFYAYDRPMTDHPWRVMLATFPALAQPQTAAQRAFVAGYVAHLTLDELWSLQIVRPYFGQGVWATPPQRFFLLNALLVQMDMRDYRLLERWQRPALLGAEPSAWLPFMADADLRGWRDFVGQQLPDAGASLTLAVISERVGLTPEALGAFVESADDMAPLWANVPPEVVADTEAAMETQAREDLLTYWWETEP